MNKIDRRALALAEMVSDMIWGGEHGWEHASDEDFSQLIKTARKRLSPPPKGDHNTVPASTSDDGGDREEVEPVAYRYSLKGCSAYWYREEIIENPTPCEWIITPLYAHPPTPQDSGLADELEAALRHAFLFIDKAVGEGLSLSGLDAHEIWNNLLSAAGSPDDGPDSSEEFAERILTALRQPRNDGELLRESRRYVVAAPADIDTSAERISILNRIDAALARLDQGEG